MFKDRDEALKQMNEALLEEAEPEELWEDDIWEEELPDEAAYNADPAGEDLDLYSQELSQPPKRGIAGLAFTAIGLMAAILAVLIYWVLRFGG
jgi:hypothetical protein